MADKMDSEDMDDGGNSLVYSEYFRVKNQLMDYDGTFLESLSLLYVLINQNKARTSQYQIAFMRACRQVFMAFNYASRCGAIPKNIDAQDRERIKNIGQGKASLADLEWCSDKFNNWYSETGFFNIVIDNKFDPRPSRNAR